MDLGLYHSAYMKVTGEDLVFDADDADALLSIMATYVPAVRADAKPEDREELKRIWEKAGDFSHFQLIKGIWELKKDGVFTFEAYNDMQTKSLGRTVVISEDETEIAVFPGSRRLLSQAINWASAHLVEGSVVLQNAAGNILNSSFEDNPISQGLGSTNESLARRHTDSLLKAGQKAAEWLLWLDLEET